MPSVGIKALRKLQIGAETTAGTAVAATTFWRGLGTIEDQLGFEFDDEDVGVLNRSVRSHISKLQAGLAMDSVAATFEQLPYILEAGVKQVAAPTTADAGSGRAWLFPFPTATANTVQTYTIEGGDNIQAEEMEYCFVDSFTLSGEVGQPWKISANWIGRQVKTTTFTSDLSLPAVTDILFNKTSLYIDQASSVGTTLKSNTLIAAELAVGKTGTQAVTTADGDLYFSFLKQVASEATLRLTFEHDSSSVDEIAAWRAETERAIRIKTLGAALATTGATYANKQLQIDCWGKWEKFEKLGERDGNDIVTGTLRIGYNSTADKMAEILVVNELDTLP